MKTPSFSTKFFLFVILFTITNAGQLYSSKEQVIICLVPLEYADAEQLADVMAPFLSPQGNIAAYSPTNTLIIKDQTSVVKNLIKVIKGKPYLSECQNLQDAPATNQQNPPG
jgi:type II secretory pathway component GspD/PulD (secretin)